MSRHRQGACSDDTKSTALRVLHIILLAEIALAVGVFLTM